MAKNKEAASENREAIIGKNGAKIASIIGYVLILAVLAFGIFIIVKNNANKINIDYSKGLTKEGKIKDVDVAVCIEAPDYKNMVVHGFEIELTEDEIQAKIDDILSDYWSADEDGNQIDTVFDDEFCMAQFGMTCDEYRKKLNDENKEERIAEFVNSILDTDTTVKTYPGEYIEALSEVLIGNDLSQYQAYNNLSYQYTGAYAYNSFNEFSEMTDEEYNQSVFTRAAAQAKIDLVIQYIFEQEGMSITKDEYKDFCASVGADVEKQYGKGYLMKSMMYDKVMNYLVENVTYYD